MVGAMTESAGESERALPTAPTLPMDAPAEVAEVGVVRSARGAETRALRWLTEIALPVAVGIMCAVTWAGALILAAWDGLPLGELRVAQAALLLSMPLTIAFVGMLTSHPENEANPARQRAVVNALLTLLAIALGLSLGFLAIAPLPADNTIVILFTAPFAGPGFSLGVALGYAYGARPRPTGAGVGLMGGVGFATPLAALAVTLFVLASQPQAQCVGSRVGCGLVVAFEDVVGVMLLVACVFAIGLTFIGGILGAYLRRR